MNFFTDPRKGRSTPIPVVVQVYEWVGGKHACADLNDVSLQLGLRDGDFTMAHAAFKVALSKMA